MQSLPSRLWPFRFAPLIRLIPALALAPALGFAIGCASSVPREVATETIKEGKTIYRAR